MSAADRVNLLAALIRAGAIPGRAQSVRVACQTAQVEVRDVEARVEAMRVDGARYAPPVAVDPGIVRDLRRQLAEAEAMIRRLREDRRARQPASSAAANTAKQKIAGNMRGKGDGLERRCCRCRKWYPATPEWFYVRNPASGALTAMCHGCRKEYQRERYLSVTMADALDRARLEFVLVDGDEAVGLACVCGEPLEVGDHVVGDAHLRHKGCAGVET